MTYTLHITQQAEDELSAIIHFIEQHWPSAVKMDLLASLAHKMQLIESMPYMYRTSTTQPLVRECTVNQHIVMYYQVMETSARIEVLSFRDNRRRKQ